jgi:hypothetical protein
VKLKRLEARWIAMEKPADANFASASGAKNRDEKFCLALPLMKANDS